MTEDSRDHVRVDSVLELEFRHEEATARSRIEDLGEGGAFVDTACPLPVGCEIEFKLKLPEEQEPIVGKAVVRWQQPTVGMGIEFQGLAEADRERIKFHVASRFFEA